MHCWWEAFLFVGAWVGVALGGTILFGSFLFGILWGLDHAAAKFARTAPTAATIAKNIALSALGLAVLIAIAAGMFSARNYVCARGFKQAWHESWAAQKSK